MSEHFCLQEVHYNQKNNDEVIQMGKLEDLYIKEKETADKSLPEIIEMERFINSYNDNIDTILNLLPKINEKISSLPPTALDWVIINGESCIAWTVCCNLKEISSYESSTYELDYSRTINLMQDGSLIGSQDAYEVIRCKTGKCDRLYMGHIHLRHITTDDYIRLISNNHYLHTDGKGDGIGVDFENWNEYNSHPEWILSVNLMSRLINGLKSITNRLYPPPPTPKPEPEKPFKEGKGFFAQGTLGQHY